MYYFIHLGPDLLTAYNQRKLSFGVKMLSGCTKDAQ